MTVNQNIANLQPIFISGNDNCIDICLSYTSIESQSMSIT